MYKRRLRNTTVAIAIISFVGIMACALFEKQESVVIPKDETLLMFKAMLEVDLPELWQEYRILHETQTAPTDEELEKWEYKWNVGKGLYEKILEQADTKSSWYWFLVEIGEKLFNLKID
jgi:hypothetical protein